MREDFMTMPKLNEQELDSVGKVGRFFIGLFLFVLYVFLSFTCRGFSYLWAGIYFLFLGTITAWSVIGKKAAVLVGFLTGTVVAAGLIGVFIYVVLSNMGC